MTVELTKEQERLIEEQLATGLYGSRGEVVAEALALLSDYAQLEQLKLERLRAEVQKGLESGESTPLDMQALKAEARRRYDERRTRWYSLMPVVLKRSEAEADLFLLWERISLESPDAADRILDRLVESFDMLATQPLMG